MRRNVMALVAILVFAFPCLALAEGSSLDVGLMSEYFDYKEDLNAPLKSTESGWLPGAYLTYTYQKKMNFYTKAHLEYLSGDITFDGTTQGGTPVSFTDSSQKLFKLEWDLGYTFNIGGAFQLTPYVGYGYRYWQRGKTKITPTYRSYEEEYSWSYVPVGIRADYAINSQLSVGGTMAVNIMFNGKMKAKLSQVVAGLNDPDFDLGNKTGFYTELPITYKITRNWAIVGTPWYEYSAIGQSDNANITFGNTVIGYAYEPASKTHQYGFRLGASYTF